MTFVYDHRLYMIFQVSNHRENHFLELLDDDYLPIKLIYIKSSPWLNQFSHLNSLCARVTTAITNHALTSSIHIDS